LTQPETKTTTISRRLFKFSAPENESTPEPSPERKLNPETLTSGDSDFESATGSPAPKPTRRLIDTIEGGPQVKTEQIKFFGGGPQDDFEENHPPVESSYFTEPQPDPPYSPIKNLFSAIKKHNQPINLHTTTMAQPVNRTKELNLNKPKAFDGN
jgi:hypothetical protein